MNMNNARKWWIAAAAAVAATAAIGVGAGVMAQTPVPGTDTGKSMVDRVAEKLGISSDELSTAIESSAFEAIDERVAAGDLTQEQADALKERISELPDDALIGPGGHGFGRGGPGGHMFRAFFVEGLADFLGITEDQLRTELQVDGATLASVAEAHGKSRDELKAFLTDGLKTRLDERVAAGDLTQAEADERLAAHAERLEEMIDGKLPSRGERHFGGPMGGDVPFGDDAPTTEPTTTATDSSTS
jgi:uncharacterized protein YidB (DUF937 family)